MACSCCELASRAAARLVGGLEPRFTEVPLGVWVRRVPIPLDRSSPPELSWVDLLSCRGMTLWARGSVVFRGKFFRVKACPPAPRIGLGPAACFFIDGFFFLCLFVFLAVFYGVGFPFSATERPRSVAVCSGPPPSEVG